MVFGTCFQIGSLVGPSGQDPMKVQGLCSGLLTGLVGLLLIAGSGGGVFASAVLGFRLAGLGICNLLTQETSAIEAGQHETRLLQQDRLNTEPQYLGTAHVTRSIGRAVTNQSSEV